LLEVCATDRDTCARVAGKIGSMLSDIAGIKNHIPVGVGHECDKAAERIVLSAF